MTQYALGDFDQGMPVTFDHAWPPDFLLQGLKAVAPSDNTDPLVAIRQQELSLRGAEIQERARQFEERQQLEREKERNDVLINQQRIDLTEEANQEKVRVAEERIQTQRDIAAANLQRRR